jgi:hypothetical protein
MATAVRRAALASTCVYFLPVTAILGSKTSLLQRKRGLKCVSLNCPLPTHGYGVAVGVVESEGILGGVGVVELESDGILGWVGVGVVESEGILGGVWVVELESEGILGGVGVVESESEGILGVVGVGVVESEGILGGVGVGRNFRWSRSRKEF